MGMNRALKCLKKFAEDQFPKPEDAAFQSAYISGFLQAAECSKWTKYQVENFINDIHNVYDSPVEVELVCVNEDGDIEAKPVCQLCGSPDCN